MSGGIISGYDSFTNGIWDYTVRNVSLDAIATNSYLNSGNVTGLYQYALSGSDTITGSGLADGLCGWGGNDVLSGGAGNDTIDGGAGIDISTYTGNRANFTITSSGTGFIVTDTTGTNGTDTLTNVERLVFADTQVALDIEGAAGQAYRLYQAAFNRTPDIGGLTYWTNVMDNGTTLVQVASGFTGSAEFQGMYGVNPTNDTFVTALYSNVLHRTPDSGGNAYE